MRNGWNLDVVRTVVEQNIVAGAIVDSGGHFVATERFKSLQSKILTALDSYHETDPLSPGIMLETLREQVAGNIPGEIFRSALGSIIESGKAVLEKDLVYSKSHKPELSNAQQRTQTNYQMIYDEAGLTVPTLADATKKAIADSGLSVEEGRKVFQLLINSGVVLKITEELFYSSGSIEDLKEKLRRFAEESTDRLIGVPEFKALAGVSRKYAIPLLEYLDAKKITRRAGDKRMIL